ncbi:type II toxin-antitoxin system VapC family toxin [Streptomyces graminilatus]|uniref:type II toxin-antitoxin system VapC family toxin n=1 Tax=Streptomyces graminilatus TaxID=1464070 RepID=UPI0006E356F7|nr:type II toxin-antitoxin system VapC family toxin [Streptomyces graminilatus]
MNRETPVVLDSSAVLAWVFHEEGADFVDELLPEASMSTANFAEVTTVCLRRGYLNPPEQLHQDLTALGLRVEPTSVDEAVRAGKLVYESYRDRQHYGGRTLALGDALCIALGERLNRPLVTGDTLWKDLEARFTVPVNLFR